MKRLSLLLLAAMLVPSGYANAEQILHYTFNGNAIDMTGHGYNGTIYGTTSYSAGDLPESGNALSVYNPEFGGICNQYVSLPDLTSVLGNSSFTIAIKYKTATDASTTSGYNGTLLANNPGPNVNGIAWNINAINRPAPNGLISDNGSYRLFGNFTSSGTPVTTDGQWHRATLTVHRDLRTMTFYVDGGAVSVTDLIDTPLHTTSFANLTLGGVPNVPNGARVLIDDVQIYNNWMNQSEVGGIRDARIIYPTNNDPANQIRFSNATGANQKRDQLVNYIWPNGLPTSTMPTVTQNITFPSSDLNGVNQSLVSSVDKLDTNVAGADFHSTSYLIHPQTTNSNTNRVLIVHQGHQDWSQGGLDSTTNKALEAGYTVIAMAMPIMDWNQDTTITLPNSSTLTLDGTSDLDQNPHNEFFTKLVETGAFNEGAGFRFFLEPVVQSINYFKSLTSGEGDVTMVGLSGGAWTTHLAAALDTRIKLSVPVAGSAPLYAHNDILGPDEYYDLEQTFSPLFGEDIGGDGGGGGVATWLEIYALGGYGEGRKEVMVTNLYDPVAFAGEFVDTFEDVVTDEMANLSGSWEYYRETALNPGHAITGNVQDNILFANMAAMGGLMLDQGELVTTPEPSTALLSAIGMLGFVACAWCRRRARQ